MNDWKEARPEADYFVHPSGYVVREFGSGEQPEWVVWDADGFDAIGQWFATKEEAFKEAEFLIRLEESGMDVYDFVKKLMEDNDQNDYMAVRAYGAFM